MAGEVAHDLGHPVIGIAHRKTPDAFHRLPEREVVEAGFTAEEPEAQFQVAWVLAFRPQ